MSELTLFDCNASFGVRPDKGFEERWSLEHLLDDMHLAGIAGALVWHQQSLHYDPMHGNRRLIREIEPYRKRLFPLWTALPDCGGDFPRPDELLDEMDEEGVSALALFPKTCALPITGSALEPLAEALSLFQRLLVVPYSEFTSFEQAETFLKIFSGSPVLFTDILWTKWRELMALMDVFTNLHIEFSAFQANRAVEWCSTMYGAKRCLFGTGMPQKSPGAARAFLDFTLLDEGEARLVAGENLKRLLDGEGPSAPPAPSQWHDSITEETRNGRPCPALALDAHCHVLHDEAFGAGGPYVMVHGDAKGLIEINHRMGVDLTAVMSWNGTVGMDAAAGNQVTLEAVEQFPEELAGLCTLNPIYQSPEEMQEEIRKYHLRHGFRGLKPYRRTPLPYNHPRFEPWWRFGAEHHLYGLFHLSVGRMEPVADIARRYPNFHCLIAHVGGSFAMAREVAPYIKELPNLYAELTLTPVTNGIIEWLVKEVGAERVLFGTDAPMRDPRPQLGWVIYTRLSEKEKRQILGENFRRILRAGRLPHPLPPCLH